MEVVIVYSHTQLEKTVQFIGNNNPHFLGQFDEIKNSILQTMRDLSKKFPNGQWIATMGYIVIADISSIESMNDDENRVIYDIMVDPAVGDDSFWADGDVREELFQFTASKEPGEAL